MSKNFEDVLANELEYDEESQQLLRSLKFAGQELVELKSMKRTEGWKILDKKIREELHARIAALVEKDPQVLVLLAFLKVADTKSLEKILDQEIEKILPDG